MVVFERNQHQLDWKQPVTGSDLSKQAPLTQGATLQLWPGMVYFHADVCFNWHKKVCYHTKAKRPVWDCAVSACSNLTLSSFYPC